MLFRSISVNGIIYTYDQTNNSWTKTSTSANVVTTDTANITSNTTSTSTTTGALKVAGGVGVTGNVYAGAVYTDSYFYANGSVLSGGVGYTGSTGSGYTGSRGYSGSVGFVGSTGVGFVGSQGIIGYTGSAGTGGAVPAGLVRRAHRRHALDRPRVHHVPAQRSHALAARQAPARLVANLGG